MNRRTFFKALAAGAVAAYAGPDLLVDTENPPRRRRRDRMIRNMYDGTLLIADGALAASGKLGGGTKLIRAWVRDRRDAVEIADFVATESR